MEDVLTLFADRYGLPVYLTETSWPGSVDERVAWLRDSVRGVDELRAKGVDVVGYTWWSLFDMMYWTYRDENEQPERYLAHMGLWDLKSDGRLSFDRLKTAAADEYLRVVKAHS
jgi:hypothetical protein